MKIEIRDVRSSKPPVRSLRYVAKSQLQARLIEAIRGLRPDKWFIVPGSDAGGKGVSPKVAGIRRGAFVRSANVAIKAAGRESDVHAYATLEGVVVRHLSSFEEDVPPAPAASGDDKPRKATPIR